MLMLMLEDREGNVLCLPAMPMQQTKVRPAAARTTHKFLVVHRIIISNLDIRDKGIVVELIDEKRGPRRLVLVGRILLYV